jgi:hypothetical protein
MNEPIKQTASSKARKRAPSYLFENDKPAEKPADTVEESELDVTADVVADRAAPPPPTSGMLKVNKGTEASIPPVPSSRPPRPTSTPKPPPLPGRAVTTPSSAPTPAPRIVSVSPTGLSVEESKELRALLGTAERALSTLCTTIREMDRRLGELEKNAPVLDAATPDRHERPTLPAPPNESGDGDSSSLALPPPAPVPAVWDGVKRRRHVALALMVSAVLGLTGLLAAMACSYSVH